MKKVGLEDCFCESGGKSRKDTREGAVIGDSFVIVGCAVI